MGTNKSSLTKNDLSQRSNSNYNIVNNMNEKESEKSEIFIDKKD